jgi:hypothetical protein
MQKIKNLKYASSELKDKMELSSILGKRNRLLGDSDWTQMPDVDLTDECKHLWKAWRKRVRSVDVLDKKSLQTLNDLEENRPPKIYKEEPKEFVLNFTFPNLEDVRSNALLYMRSLYNMTLQKFDYTMVDEAKYIEAMSYLTDEYAGSAVPTIDLYPLLRLEAALKHMDTPLDVSDLKSINDYKSETIMQNIAKYYIDAKKNWIIEVSALEAVYHEKCKLIRQATSIEEIEQIKKDAEQKLWTLTLT